jgi:hypothetical protein
MRVKELCVLGFCCSYNFGYVNFFFPEDTLVLGQPNFPASIFGERHPQSSEYRFTSEGILILLLPRSQ